MVVNQPTIAKWSTTLAQAKTSGIKLQVSGRLCEAKPEAKSPSGAARKNLGLIKGDETHKNRLGLIKSHGTHKMLWD